LPWTIAHAMLVLGERGDGGLRSWGDRRFRPVKPLRQVCAYWGLDPSPLIIVSIGIGQFDADVIGRLGGGEGGWGAHGVVCKGILAARGKPG